MVNNSTNLSLNPYQHLDNSRDLRKILPILLKTLDTVLKNQQKNENRTIYLPVLKKIPHPRLYSKPVNKDKASKIEAKQSI